MKVQFTPPTGRQFLEAVAHIQFDNPSAARRFRINAESVLRRLEEFPESGRLIPEIPDLPHREIIIKTYRFFYRVDKNTVGIIAD